MLTLGYMVDRDVDKPPCLRRSACLIVELHLSDFLIARRLGRCDTDTFASLQDQWKTAPAISAYNEKCVYLIPDQFSRWLIFVGTRALTALREQCDLVCLQNSSSFVSGSCQTASGLLAAPSEPEEGWHLCACWPPGRDGSQSALRSEQLKHAYFVSKSWLQLGVRFKPSKNKKCFSD